jgi:hypothetical protein
MSHLSSLLCPQAGEHTLWLGRHLQGVSKPGWALSTPMQCTQKQHENKCRQAGPCHDEWVTPSTRPSTKDDAKTLTGAEAFPFFFNFLYPFVVCREGVVWCVSLPLVFIYRSTQKEPSFTFSWTKELSTYCKTRALFLVFYFKQLNSVFGGLCLLFIPNWIFWV